MARWYIALAAAQPTGSELQRTVVYCGHPDLPGSDHIFAVARAQQIAPPFADGSIGTISQRYDEHFLTFMSKTYQSITISLQIHSELSLPSEICCLTFYSSFYDFVHFIVFVTATFANRNPERDEPLYR